MKLLALVFLALCSAPCFADCPSTSVLFRNRAIPDFVTTASQLDTVLFANGDQACVQFDLSKGLLFSCLYGPGSPWLEIDMQDDFVIQGLPSGTPVINLQPEFVLKSVPYSGSYDDGVAPGYLPQIRSDSQIGNCTCSNWMDTEIGLNLNEVAGQPFRLYFRLLYTNGTSAWPISSVDGTWHFENMPEGSSIVSCHGFHQDAPVPTKTESWGSVKARYR